MGCPAIPPWSLNAATRAASTSASVIVLPIDAPKAAAFDTPVLTKPSSMGRFATAVRCAALRGPPEPPEPPVLAKAPPPLAGAAPGPAAPCGPGPAAAACPPALAAPG